MYPHIWDEVYDEPLFSELFKGIGKAPEFEKNIWMHAWNIGLIVCVCGYHAVKPHCTTRPLNHRASLHMWVCPRVGVSVDPLVNQLIITVPSFPLHLPYMFSHHLPTISWLFPIICPSCSRPVPYMFLSFSVWSYGVLFTELATTRWGEVGSAGMQLGR